MPISRDNAKRYPQDWSSAIVPRIRERSGNRCECTGQCGLNHSGRCGSINGLPNPRTGSIVVLTTMHLDHVPENVDDDNLLHACQQCHLRYDRDHHAANAKRTRELKRRRILDKAGQLAFETYIFGPSK